jgi:hypothetical protein
MVHLLFSGLLVLVILLFRVINNESVVMAVFRIAGYTYGPLLGLYSFGLFSRRKVNDRITPAIAVFSPIVCFFLSKYSVMLFNGYKFGFELLLLNGLLTFAGLYIFSRKPD